MFTYFFKRKDGLTKIGKSYSPISGSVYANKSSASVNIKVNDDVHSKLKIYAAKKGQMMAVAAERLILDGIKRDEPKSAKETATKP